MNVCKQAWTTYEGICFVLKVPLNQFLMNKSVSQSVVH